MKITVAAINRMVFAGSTPKAKDLRWDDEVPGFAVRVFPSGSLSLVFIYRFEGRERLMTLGPYGILTLQQGRDQARELKLLVLRGRDPLEELRKKKQAGATFGDLAAAYRERHMGKKKSARDDDSMLRNDLEAWRRRPLTSIKRADVAQLHHTVGKRAPIRANRVVALLSKMFNLAKTWGLLHEHWSNPASGIDRNKEVGRERYVTPDEMPRLVAEIRKEENPYVRAAIWMYLLTGKRKQEVLGLKWANVDFTRKVIRIPQTKSGKPDVVQIIPAIETLLRALPRASGNPYVFCGAVKGRPLSDMKSNWKRIRKGAGLEDVRIHDLRHTVASWLLSSGHSLALVGQVLNHSDPRMTKRYAHFLTAPLHDALQAHGNAIQRILGEGGHQAPPLDASVDSGAPSAN